MIARLGIGGALMAQPSDDDFNHRLSREQVHANFLARMSEAVGDPAIWTQVADAAEASITANFATVRTYARAVALRYGDSHHRALSEFVGGAVHSDRTQTKSEARLVGKPGVQNGKTQKT